MSDKDIPTAGNFTTDGKITYDELIADTRKILAESKQHHQRQETVTVLGREFFVHPRAFSPAYFNSSTICAKNLPASGGTFLEVGAGIGTVVLSLLLENKIASAVATDINEHALQALRKNINKFNLQKQVDVRAGSVFEPIETDEVFDTVFWNTPFGYVENQELSDLEKGAFDPDYQSIKKFLAQAKSHTTAEVNAYFSFSNTLGKTDELQTVADEVGVEYEAVFKTTLEQDFPVDYEIMRIILFPNSVISAIIKALETSNPG